MRTKPEYIARTLHEYGDGASLKKVREHLKQHDNIKITRWAIRKGVVKYSYPINFVTIKQHGKNCFRELPN